MVEYQKYMAHLNIFSLENVLPLPGICCPPQIPGHWVWPAVTFHTAGRPESLSSRGNRLLRGGPTEPAGRCHPGGTNEHRSQREKRLCGRILDMRGRLESVESPVVGTVGTGGEGGGVCGGGASIPTINAGKNSMAIDGPNGPETGRGTRKLAGPGWARNGCSNSPLASAAAEEREGCCQLFLHLTFCPIGQYFWRSPCAGTRAGG